MNDDGRLFGVSEVDALVPRLQEIFTAVRDDLAAAQRLVLELAHAGYPIPDGGLVAVDTQAPPTVRRLQSELLDRSRAIAESVQEVKGMGAEVKAIDGLVDFRSRYRGRIVYLCWRYGEPAVAHWHDLDVGFAGRSPLGDEDEFEGGYLQ